MLRKIKIFKAKLKQIFTLKRIIAFLMSAFVVLFFVGGCSFKYMDWQYYVYEKLCDTAGGYYIYDNKLYDEILIVNQNRNNAYNNIEFQIKNDKNSEWLKNKEKYIDIAIKTNEYLKYEKAVGNSDKDWFKNRALEIAQLTFIYDEIDKKFPAKLSNDYFYTLQSGYAYHEKEKIITTKYSRIVKYIDYEYSYKDNSGNKNLITQGIEIGYHKYGLWLSGDEGAGFSLREHEILTCFNKQKFILKDNKWKIETR